LPHTNQRPSPFIRSYSQFSFIIRPPQCNYSYHSTVFTRWVR